MYKRRNGPQSSQSIRSKHNQITFKFSIVSFLLVHSLFRSLNFHNEMKLSVALALLFSGVVVLSNPVPSHGAPGGEIQNWTSPQAGSQSYFLPSTIANYNVGTGGVTCGAQGKVFKSDSDNGNDITTLLTFTYPQAVSGMTCSFEFYLTSTDPLSGDNGGLFDVFTSLEPTDCVSGNNRNIQLGRMQPVNNGFATWDATYSTYLTQPGPCDNPGTEVSLELVPVGDNDDIEWNPFVSGARIYYGP
jgi:hypothetical protein